MLIHQQHHQPEFSEKQGRISDRAIGNQKIFSPPFDPAPDGDRQLWEARPEEQPVCLSDEKKIDRIEARYSKI
ncbi:MAG: hypothetical protein AB4352_03690 [Hormoscilla sp.]